MNPIESAKFLRLMSNEYAFKCAFVGGSTCCSYVLKRDASHLLVIHYVPRSPMFRLLEYTQGLIVRHFDRASTKDSVTVYCTRVKCIVRCVVRLFSLFFPLLFFYILDTLALRLSRSRSLYLFLSLSTDSNVSRQRNSARSFRDDVSRSIDSQTLIDFSIFQLARTGCTHGH